LLFFYFTPSEYFPRDSRGLFSSLFSPVVRIFLMFPYSWLRGTSLYMDRFRGLTSFSNGLFFFVLSFLSTTAPHQAAILPFSKVRTPPALPFLPPSFPWNSLAIPLEAFSVFFPTLLPLLRPPPKDFFFPKLPARFFLSPWYGLWYFSSVSFSSTSESS